MKIDVISFAVAHSRISKQYALTSCRSFALRRQKLITAFEFVDPEQQSVLFSCLRSNGIFVDLDGEVKLCDDDNRE